MQRSADACRAPTRRPQTSPPTGCVGPGQAGCCRALGLRESLRLAATRLGCAARPAHRISARSRSASGAIVAWLLLRHSAALAPDIAPWLGALAALLMLLPASEAAVAVINRLISESAPAEHLPRLASRTASPPSTGRWSSIPAMLDRARTPARRSPTSCSCTTSPIRERGVQFALLTDWRDAATERLPDDAALLDEAVQRDRARSTRAIRRSRTRRRRFIVLHRGRGFAETEQRWIGWERKRGKLEQLLGLLAEGAATPFVDLGRVSRRRPGVRYVVTLDSDTAAAARAAARPGRHRRPSAQPAAAVGRRPAGRRAATASCSRTSPRRCRAPEDVTLYHWLFAGQSGIDPYSVASPRSTRTCSAKAPSPARACSTCRRCTRCSAAGCRRARC